MKNIYITEPGDKNLTDIMEVINRIDPCHEKYRLIENPFDKEDLRYPKIEVILSRTNSESIDLMVFPLHQERPDLSDDYALDYAGVQMALVYRCEGYSNPVLLITEHDFGPELEKSAREIGGYLIREWRQYVFATTFLNLYSARMRIERKARKLVHLLDGIPEKKIRIRPILSGSR